MDLRQLASHFYDLAARVLELFEEEEIVDILSEVRISITKGWTWLLLRVRVRDGHWRLTCCVIQTFKERAAEIADHAHNPRGALGDAQDFLRGLDEMERQCRCLEYLKIWIVVLIRL